MKNLYMLIGEPCVGKDTFIQNNLKDDTFSPHIISLDDIIEEVAKILNCTYSDIFQSVSKFAEKELNRKIDNYFKYGTNVIWNQTNLTINSRRKKLCRVPNNYNKIAIDFYCPIDILFERNNKRFKETGKFIPESVIISMWDSYQAPSFDEGFSETWDVDGTNGKILNMKKFQTAA